MNLAGNENILVRGFSMRSMQTSPFELLRHVMKTIKFHFKIDTPALPETASEVLSHGTMFTWLENGIQDSQVCPPTTSSKLRFNLLFGSNMLLGSSDRTVKIFKLKPQDSSSTAFVATFMYEWRKLDAFQLSLDKYFAKIAMVCPAYPADISNMKGRKIANLPAERSLTYFVNIMLDRWEEDYETGARSVSLAIHYNCLSALVPLPLHHDHHHHRDHDHH
eukprot:764261-Hanusia_phi.AAC.1